MFGSIEDMTHQELKEAVKIALKNRETERLSVLRGLLAAETNELIIKGRKPDEELSEEDLMILIRRGAKQRKDSIEQFEKGGRPELAESEKRELAILETFLPSQISEGEIRLLVQTKAKEMGITDKTKSNQLMGVLMKELKGNADGTIVKRIVENFFQ